MPFNIASFINGISNSLLNSPFTISTFRNPMWASLILTLAIIVVILFIFTSAAPGASALMLAGRAGFWIFLLSCGAIFLNNKILIDETSAKAISGEYDGLIGGALISDRSEIVPVHINTNFEDL